MARRQEVTVEVEGRRLRLSNLDKVLYPATGFTKAGVIDYYRRIAPAMLPHLAGRALTMIRFPDGVGGGSFFEKQCPDHRPPWVHTADVVERSKDNVIRHCVVDGLATLVWTANLAAIELHVPMARAADPDRPTMVVFDLDPGPPAGIVDSARVGLTLRRLLDHAGLDCVPKLSGRKGLHVYVPLNETPGPERPVQSGERGPERPVQSGNGGPERPVQSGERGPERPVQSGDGGPERPDQAACRTFARQVAERIARDDRSVVTTMRKDVRRGRVFIDWSQNARHKTTVAAYSLRATDIPSVSAPLAWSEVERIARGEGPASIGPDEAVARVGEFGDLLAPALARRQHLPTGGEGLDLFTGRA